jgi:cell shape-determining protein MreC
MTKSDTTKSLANGAIAQQTDLLIRETEALRRERMQTKQEVFELLAPHLKSLERLAATNQAFAAENAGLIRDLNTVAQLMQQQMEVWERLLMQLADLKALLKRLDSKPLRGNGLI